MKNGQSVSRFGKTSAIPTAALPVGVPDEGDADNALGTNIPPMDEDEAPPQTFRRLENRARDPGLSDGGRANSGDPWIDEETRAEASTVADVMTKNVKTVDPEASIRSVAELMQKEDVGVIPVVRNDGRLLGLLTDRDIVLRAIAAGKAVDECRAKDLATTNIEVASMHDSLSNLIQLMGHKQIRRVPVVDENDYLVGIVSLGDIATRAGSDRELEKAFEKISGRGSLWSRMLK